MIRLFLGLCLVLLDYKVAIGTARVEILPDFAGFLLLMRVMETRSGKSKAFDRGRHWAFAMAIASGILFGADLLNPDTLGKIWLWEAELVALAVTLGLVRSIISGLEDLGMQVQMPRGMWPVLAVLQLLCALLGWVPLVGRICAPVSMATGVLFLISVYKTMKSAV